MYEVVIDTNVLVAAMRSRSGASFRLLSLLGDQRWRPNLTVAIFMEYESVLKRNCTQFFLSEEDIDDALDAIAAAAGKHQQHLIWRTVAADPDDDLVLERRLPVGVVF